MCRRVFGVADRRSSVNCLGHVPRLLGRERDFEFTAEFGQNYFGYAPAVESGEQRVGRGRKMTSERY